MSSVYWVIACVGLTLSGCGEQYTNQGNALGRAINDNLIALKICHDYSNCNSKVVIFGGHGNKVNFAIYEVKNPEIISAITGFVAANGIRITQGVPISLSFYAESHESKQEMFSFSKPVVKLEVLK